MSEQRTEEDAGRRRARRLFRLARAAVYLTLLYSTGLHLIWGLEPTVRTTYFSHAPNPRYDARFPDFGRTHDAPLETFRDQGFKLGGFATDQAEYLLMAERAASPITPYRQRFLVPAIVGALSRASGMSAARTFAYVNVGCVLAAAFVFEAFLRRAYGFDRVLRFVGGLLFVTMVGVTRTLAFAMLEPASLLAMAAIAWAVVADRRAVFLVLACVGVATKEVLIVSGLLWLAHHASFTRRGRLAVDLFTAAAPLLALVAIRAVLGSDPTRVAGLDVDEGDPSRWIARLASLRGAGALAGSTFLAFGFLWVGLASARTNATLARHATLVPLVLLAAFALSQQTTRVLGILFPIVIPGFLLLLAPMLGHANASAGDADG